MRSRTILLRRAVVVVVSFVCSLCCADDTKAAKSSADTVKLRELVRQLGDDSFAIRKKAYEELKSIGPPAREALLKGLEHADAEVKRACQRLLPDILAAHFRMRLDHFAKSGADADNFPCWKAYREIVGDGESQRKLFVEMFKKEEGLLLSVDVSPDAAAAALASRLRVVRTSSITRPTLATLLFVGGYKSVSSHRLLVNHSSWYTILRNTSATKILKDDEPLRKLAGRWVMRPSGMNLLRYRIQLCLKYSLPECEELGRAVAVQNHPGLDRGWGIQLLAAAKNRRALPEIAEMLKDKGAAGAGNLIQMRDVALGWLIHLTEQKHQDYGMRSAAMGMRHLKRSKDYLIRSHYFRFSNPTQRDTAIKKWEKWRTDNKARYEALAAALPSSPNAAGKPDGNRPAPDEAKGESQKDKGEKKGGQKDESVKKDGQAKKRAKNDGAKNEATEKQVKQKKPQEKAAKKKAPKQDAKKQDAKKNDAKKNDAKKNDARQVPLVIGRVMGNSPNNRDFELPFPRADREIVVSFRKAKAALADENYAVALSLLGDLLRQPADVIFQETLDGRVNGLKQAVSHLLSTVSSEKMAAYEDLYGAVAKRELDKAIESGEREHLIQLADQHFFTKAGADAAFLLGRFYFDQGRYPRSTFFWQRLRDESPHAMRYQPTLDARLATAYQMAGKSHEVARLLKDGRVSRQQIEQSVAALVKPLMDDTSWLNEFGNTQQNMLSAYAIPIQGHQVASYLLGEVASEHVASRMKFHQKQHQIMLPSTVPIVVGETVIARLGDRLIAANARTGDLRWQVEHQDRLTATEQQMAKLDGAAKSSMDSALNRGLIARIWSDQSFGRIVSDGNSVFVIEGQAFGSQSQVQHIVVGLDGRRRLQPNLNALQLAAYDVRTGKLKWLIGGTKYESAWPMAGVRFLGRPMIFDGRLYVIAQFEKEAALCELNSETGKLQWKLRVGDSNLSQGSVLACVGGKLVCRVGNYALACIDTNNRRIGWIKSFAPKMPETGGPMAQFRVRQMQLAMLRQTTSLASSRSETSAVTQEGRVVVLLPDQPQIFSFDIETGDVLWEKAKGNTLYMAGIDGKGHVVFVHGDRISAYKMADGSPQWKQDSGYFPGGSIPVGRSYLTDEDIFVPLSSGEVARYSTTTGGLLARTRHPDATMLGNLVSSKHALVACSPKGIYRFDPLEPLFRELADKVKKNGNGKDLAKLGQLEVAKGDLGAALTHLRQAGEAGEDVAKPLAEAVLDALSIEYDRLRSEVTDDDLKLAEAGSVTTTRQLVQVYLKHAEFSRAFGLLATMATEDTKANSEMTFIGANHQVQVGEWVRIGLVRIWQATPEGDRQQLIAKLDAIENEKLRRSIKSTLPGLPEATSSSIEQAETALKKNQLAQADWHWRRLVQNKHAEDVRARAAAQLAKLYGDAKYFTEADRWYQLIESKFANSDTGGGKTGGELVAAIDAKSELGLFRAGKLKTVWQSEKIQTTKGRAARRSNYYDVPVEVRAIEVGRKLPHLRVDFQKRRLTAYEPDGRKLWSISTGASRSPFFGVPTANRCTFAGNIMVVQSGPQLMAIDCFKKSVIWTKTTSSSFGNVIMFNPFGGVTSGVTNSTYHVRNDRVVFGGNSALTCVDLLTGKQLWKRSVGSPITNVAGGDEKVIVHHAAGAVGVYRFLDGAVLPPIDLPKINQRVADVRGRWVVSDVVKKKRRLRGVNLESGKMIWSREYPEKAIVRKVNSDELVVITNKSITLLHAYDGSVLAEWEDVQEAQPATAMVMKAANRYLLVKSNNGQMLPQVIGFGFGGMRAFPMNGTLTAFSLGQKKPLWTRKLERTGVYTEPPRFLPLIFLAESGKNRNAYTAVVDIRTGKEVGQLSGQVRRVDVNDKGYVEMSSVSSESLKMTFKQQPTGPVKE